MNEPKNKLTEEELKLIEEEELFLKEVYSDPEVATAEPPADLQKKVFAQINAIKAAKREAELAEEKRKEEQELIRLGRIYKKRKGYRKYFVLAAVLVLAMLFGVTSFGEPKKMFEKVKYAWSDRKQETVDSKDEDVVPISSLKEDEANQEIEDTFGFVPVRMHYLPEQTEFLEMTISEEIQHVNLVYGMGDDAKIVYSIRPNYRTGSMGKGMEDDFIEEYIEETEYTIITMRKYEVNGTEERWLVQFEYQETLYSLSISNTDREEVNQIVENLYFP